MSRERRSGARLEQRAVVSEVLSLLRHDLRNKLASVRNAAFYLERKAEKTPLWAEARVPKFFALIESELEAAESIIKDETILARLFEPRESVVDLAVCIERAKEDLPAPVGITFERDGEASVMVAGDADELALALRCLLANAVEATPAGGSIRMRLAQQPRNVVLEISDAGPVVSQAQLANGFEPFETSKPDHAGMGLKIAKRIVDRWRGTLSLTAIPTGGARATVTFPPLEG